MHSSNLVLFVTVNLGTKLDENSQEPGLERTKPRLDYPIHVATDAPPSIQQPTSNCHEKIDQLNPPQNY